MKTAVGYGRVSSLGQLDGTSLESQKKSIEARALSEGYQLVDVYFDEALSGGSTARPQLQRMISDAREKKFETIYFTKLDRLGRNLRDVTNLYYEFEQLGVSLYCIDDPSLNTSGKMGKVVRGILGTFSEFEKDIIKERTSGGRIARWKSGSFMGELPIGYTKDENNQIIIDEKQSGIYKKIVSLYLDERLNTKKIALELTRQGIPTPSAMKHKKNAARNWNSVAVLKILKNPAYTGEVTYNKIGYEAIPGKPAAYRRHRSGDKAKPEDQWITIQLPALISEDTYQQILNRLQSQKVKPKKLHKGHEDHFLFDGLLYCGECNTRMRKIVKQEENGTIYRYYICPWHAATKDQLQLSGKERCNLKSVHADEIDEQLYGQIINLLSEPEYFLKDWLRDIDKDAAQETFTLLRKKDAELQSMITEGFKIILSIKDQASKALCQTELDKVIKEKELLQADLNNARRELQQCTNEIDRYEAFKKAINNPDAKKGFRAKLQVKGELINFLESLPFEEKKRLVEAVISPETGGKCYVQWLRPNDFLDEDELQSMNPEDREKSLIDREPYGYLEFNLDFDRIETFISGLNRSELLKETNSDSLTRRKNHARGRRRSIRRRIRYRPVRSRPFFMA